MCRHLWKTLLGLVFTAVLSYTGSAGAVSQLGQEPPASVIVSAGGLEWVWAGPCAPVDPSCGIVQLHHGFVIPTDADWLSSFADLDAIIAAFNDPDDGQKCASPYFDTVYDHCDSGDLQIGALWHLPAFFGGQFTDSPAAEAFLVRGASVPEPGMLGLLALGLMGLGTLRRRQS